MSIYGLTILLFIVTCFFLLENYLTEEKNNKKYVNELRKYYQSIEYFKKPMTYNSYCYYMVISRKQYNKITLGCKISKLEEIMYNSIVGYACKVDNPTEVFVIEIGEKYPKVDGMDLLLDELKKKGN